MGKGSNATKGALGGAATGAAVGSLGGPIGTVAGGLIGGALGGLAGWGGSDGGEALRQRELDRYGGVNRGNFNVPGFDTQWGRYSNLDRMYGNRDPRYAKSYTAGGSQFAGDQRQLADMLMADANGNGVGQQLVRKQAQDAADRGVAQQMAMANSGRPGQGAGAFRNAAMNAGNMQSQVGGQAAMAGMQARLGAMGQLGGVLQGARGQDQDLSMFNAGQRQQGSQFNSDLALRQMGLNDQSQLEALRQRMALAGMQQQGGMGYEQNRTSRYGAAMGMQQGPSTGDQLLGAGGGALGAYLQYKGTQRG